MVTIHGLDARISQSFPLPAACMSTTITVKWSEVRFITGDTVPLVPEVISFGYFPHPTVASPVIECQSYADNRQPDACIQCSELTTSSGESFARTDEEPRWSDIVLPDHSDQLVVFLGCGWTSLSTTLLLMRPASVSVASQNFADASLWHIQHSCHFLLRLTHCRQSYDTQQYLLLQITRHDALK